MLLTKTVKVKWHGNNREWYEFKGYVYTKMGNEFEVKVEDLSKGANVYVDVQCDGCGEILENVRWTDYNRYIKEDNKYYCNRCMHKLFGAEKTRKTKLKHGESFGYWLIKNFPLRQAVSIILRWDDELNDCDIREISYSSSKKKYYFKCLDHIKHGSEQKNVASFTQGNIGSLDCKACNSIGQYILDTYGENGLRDYWDYEKNNELGLDPFKISKGSKQNVFLFCQIHKYHGSYGIRCNDFVTGNRCPYCTNKNGKVHPLDSLGQYIVDNYGREFLDKIWSEKNERSAFEYSPMSTQFAWFKCFDDKHKDHFRKIASSVNYNFRCPECVQERDESILQEKVRLYLESLRHDALHELKCTLKPKNIIEPPNNSNKKRGKGTLRYDNEIIINNNHLFVESMGQQHDDINALYHKQTAKRYNTTPEKELEYLQAKDKYKEDYVYQQGENYYYLAVWYYHNDKNEIYKRLIDDKITEILNRNNV